MRNTIDEAETTQNLLSATIRGEIPWDENKLGPILDANAGAVQAMQRGAKLPECNWGLDYRLGVSTPGQMVMRARGLERLNHCRGNPRVSEGQGRSSREHLALGNSLFAGCWARRSRYPSLGSERHSDGHSPGDYSVGETRQIATGAEESFVRRYQAVA